MNIEMNKLKTAINYVDRIANGKNPINNEQVEDSILNSPNVIRCMFFIKDVLMKVYNNNGAVGVIYKNELPPYPFQILKNFKYENDKGIASLFKQINDMAKGINCEKVKVNFVNNWLKANGYIEKKEINGFLKKHNIVTKKGKEIGLYNLTKDYYGNKYIMVMFNKDAQEFIVNHLEEIYTVEEL